MDQTPEERPRAVQIVKILDRTPTVKSLFFRDVEMSRARPGQFAMIWVPGVDEIPMSITVDPSSRLSEIVVKAVGEATEKLQRMSQGNLIGTRGPYGTWFKVFGEGDLLVVAGGTGIVPLRRLIVEESLNRRITLVLGAKTREEIIFLDDFKRENVDVFPATEDGSMGFAGSATNCAEEKIGDKDFSQILCCGPELMIRGLVDLASKNGVPLQASLERIMRCGLGICGSCAIAGYRVCKDGPVFDLTDLVSMSKELGRTCRDHSDREIALNTQN